MTKLILLINLGTPTAPTTKAVKKYLAEFLSDSRVVELPKFLWQLILRTVVLNTRPQKSAKLYQKIWTPEGSPLMVGTKNLSKKMDMIRRVHKPHPTGVASDVQISSPADLSRFHGNDLIIVDFAMRYGSPNIREVLKKHQDVEEIIVLPLYPQYASSATGSSLEAVMREISRWRYIPAVKWINHYHDHPLYIQTLATSIQQHWQTHGRAQKLVLSYHGLPQRNIELGDPYFEQCQKTTLLLARQLALTSDQYIMTFQSRFGAAKWIEPYCSETLQQLPAQGIKSVDMICPGFAVDCLETLEEINIQNRALFLQAGGEKFNYIPCLNDSDAHVELLWELVKCAN